MADQNSSLSQKRKAQAVAKFIFDLTTPAASRYWPQSFAVLLLGR
jgi:hypothetical protein